MSESNKSVFWSKVSAALLALVVIGGGIMYAVPNEVEVEVPVNVSVPGEIVYKNVSVDNGNLGLVLDHIYDNVNDNDSVNYLTDDLDDDEVDQIVDRIVFINEIKKLAVDEVSENVIDELHKEEINVSGNTIRLDDDDIERVRVQDDDDEITVDLDSIDWDDKDAEVEVEVKFEQDDVKFIATFEVVFKDGEVDDMNLISVSTRD